MTVLDLSLLPKLGFAGHSIK